MPRYRWIPPKERDASGNAWIEIDGIAKDPNAGLNGPVYCPDSGYYDPVLDKYFHNKTEKKDYMRANGLMMHSGSKKQTEGNPGKTYYFIPGLSRTNRTHKYR